MTIKVKTVVVDVVVVVTMRHYASAAYVVVVCPSVRLSVCLSVTSLHCIPKWIYAGSRKQRRTIAQGL